MKKKMFVIICFLAVFTLSFRLFFKMQGIVGHHWDWVFPGLDVFSEKLNISSIFTWNNYNLGVVVKLVIAHLFPTSLFVLVGKLLGVKMLQFLLFFFVIFISFITFKKLLDFLFEKSDLNYLPSFLYAYSPFLFNDILGGAWSMWISYSLCPLYFVFLIYFFEKGGGKNLFFLLFLSIWTVISIQNFVLINLFALFYIINNLNFRRFTIRSIFQKTILLLFLIILINFYWILPFSYTFKEFVHGNILAVKRVFALPWIENSAQSIWNIFNLGGYFDRNMYLYSIPPVFKIIFQLAVAFVFTGILVFFIVEKNKNNIRKGVFWLSLLLILILVVKGGNNPFSEFTLWLYRNFVLMRIYRSPQHLMFVPAFIIPILISLSLSYFYRNLKYKKAVLIIFGISIAIWISGWWYNGDLGHKTLLRQRRDNVDFFRLPPELKKYYEESQKDRRDYRSFFLPAVHSPIFLKTEYQNTGNGIQPEYLYLNKQTFMSEDNIFANYVETSFCKDTNFDYIRYLSLFSVKNIILRSDIRPHFTKSSNCWDDDYVRSRLDASAALDKFLEGEYTVAYKINDVYFLPHFYVPQKSIYWKGEIKDLMENLELKDYQLRSEILLDIGDESNNLLPQIEENEEKEIFVKSYPVDLVKDEELGTYTPSKNQEPLEAKVSPGSLLYPLVSKLENFDLKSRKTPALVLEYDLLLAEKRISEFLVFGSGKPNSFNVFLSGYSEAMDAAFEILEGIKANNNKVFLENLARLQEYQRDGKKRLEKYSYGGGVKEKIEEIFKNYDLRVKELEPKHDFSRLVYQFSLPREGEYEIYVKNEGDTGDQILDVEGTETEMGENIGYRKLDTGDTNIQYPVSSIINENWKLLETKYFGEGENEYVLDNPGFGENLVTDSFKINNFTGNIVYRVSLRYRADSDRGLFSVNQSQEGKLFDYYLPKTGSELTDFEMFFRSSEDADKAFINLSVPEYEDLKIEKIRQPEIVLRRRDTGNQILDIGDGEKTTPKITFAKVNPTKYRILIEGASQPYSIVFGERFHRGWKLYINRLTDSNINELKRYGETVASYFDGEVKEGTHRMNFLEPATFETWNQKPLPEERHYQVNGYANAWRILPQDSEGQENYELIVEFEPQRLYYLGLFISFLTIGGSFVIMIITIIREKTRDIRY